MNVCHILSWLVLCGVLAGCDGAVGPRRVAVSGDVTVDGKPLDVGTIRFLPIEGNAGPAASVPISGGDYGFTSENGPMPGAYRVLIVQSPPQMGAKLSGTVIELPARMDWQVTLTVPNEASFSRDFAVSVNDPPTGTTSGK